jgi:hypothetical protein
MRELAALYGCTFSLPFNQRESQLATLAGISNVDEHIDPKAQLDGICYGLSLNWLKNAADGHDDAHFAKAFGDWENDSLFLRTMGLQHVELAKARLNIDDNDSKLTQSTKLVQSTLPGAGFDLAGAGEMNLSLPGFDRALKDAMAFINSGAEARYFVLCSHTHAMAMHKDESGRLHFFDPNGGVVSSDNPNAMARMVRDTLLLNPSYWQRGQDKVLQLFEANPANGRQAGGMR